MRMLSRHDMSLPTPSVNRRRLRVAARDHPTTTEVRLPTGRRMRRSWDRFGRSISLSPRVALLYAPIGAIGPLLQDWEQYGGSMISWLAVAAAGELVVLACFQLARWLIHGAPGRTDPRSRPVATLVAFYATVIVRALALVVGIGVVAGPAANLGSELAYRIFAAVALQVGFLIIIALYVNAHAEHRALVADLERQRRQLADLDETMQERLASMHREFVTQVHATIDPQVERLYQALEEVSRGADPTPSVQELTRFVDEELRPMSHGLSAPLAVEIQDQRSPVLQKRIRVPIPRHLLVADCILPLMSAWLMFVASVVGAVRFLGAGELIVFSLVMPGFMLVSLTVARRLVRSWAPPAIVAAAVVIGLCTIVPMVALLLLGASGLAPAPDLLSSAGMVGAVIGFFSVGYRAISQARAQTQLQLQAAVTGLQASVNVLQQSAWVTRRRLGYVMHGSVQGALQAAAMRLASPSASVDAEMIRSIKRDVSNALARLELTSPSQATLPDVLSDIATLWEGECDIQWSISQSAQAALAAQPTAAECTAEVIREAVSNATHHGRARSVDVQVDADLGVVQVLVTDDGPNWNDEWQPGLGSRMLEEMCLHWQLDRSDGQTTLSAVLALPSPALPESAVPGIPPHPAWRS